MEGWQGGAGNRIANVKLTNTGAACKLAAMSRPQLLDGRRAVMINSAPPAASAILTLQPGAVLSTQVNAANYCGQTPSAPVTAAFVINRNGGRVIARPVKQSDVSGVPPCNGAPGSAGEITMHAWAP